MSRASLETSKKSQGTIHCTADQATILKMMRLKKDDPVLKNIKASHIKAGRVSVNEIIHSSSTDLDKLYI